MKVLVIGSEGQLGSEFQKISKSYDSLSWFFSTIKTLDLLRLETINSFLNNINPTVIINCAAYTNVDKAETESKLANTINYKAVDIISKWTSENNKKLIHVSTDYVFDGLSNIPLSENSKTKPVNEYGSSKLKGEIACLKNDSNSIVIRTSWLYSSFGKNFVKTMIDLMKKNNSVKVVNDQIGSPTYAYDLAKVIIEIIMNSENKSGLFHYSNEGEISWFEFARSIKELYNLDCEIIGVSSKEFKTLAKRPKYSLLNKSKIKTTFNLEIPNYKQSLKNCIKLLKMKRNILVTGGAGFIGSHLVRLLVNKYPTYHIINMDLLTYAGNLENLKDIEHKENYSFVKCDICDFKKVKQVFVDYKIDSSNSLSGRISCRSFY